MSLIIIPLAGQDFYSKKFGIRPLYPVGNTTLIERILSNRFWINDSNKNNQILFVLLEVGAPTKTLQAFIADKFPSAYTIVLSNTSLGAPFSALAAIALATDPTMPVIVDLADINFSVPLNVNDYFSNHPEVMGLIPYFESRDPKYSYLKLSGKEVLETREKEVISNSASAGVYVFRDVRTYLNAMTYALNNPKKCSINNIFYICPIFNGLISSGQKVHAISVDDVEPIGRLFH